jgi:hypothetical protein
VPVAASAEGQDDDGVPKLGVAKSWLSEKLILKRATELDSSWLPAFEQNEIDLICYAVSFFFPRKVALGLPCDYVGQRTEGRETLG